MAQHLPHSSLPHSKGALVARSLSYQFPDGTDAFRELSFSLPNTRVGLVGANGSGKSTLLRVLTGELSPSSGEFKCTSEPLVWHQSIEVDSEAATVLDALDVRARLEILERALAGNWDPAGTDADPEWDLPDRIEAARVALNINHLDITRPLGTLSPGERLRVRLATARLSRAKVWLLDEPSNHLDETARGLLIKEILAFQGAVLVVSHDRRLLDVVAEIWELSRNGLRVYGGNYSFYDEQRAKEEAAALAQVEHARKNIREREQLARESTRSQEKRMQRGKREGLSGSLPRILVGMQKRRAELTLARGQQKHAERVNEARTKLADAREQLRGEAKISIDTDVIKPPAGRTLVEAIDFNLRFANGGRSLWRTPLNFRIQGPERWSLEGGNGAGKSTLLSQIVENGESRSTLVREGSLKTFEKRVAYLDQQLSNLNRDASVLDLYAEKTVGLDESERRVRLARFLFTGDRVFQRVDRLSGGERMRLALALALTGQPALLILDEPTNDLDLPALRQLEQVMAELPCAVLVVSHDAEFRSAVGLTNRLCLDDLVLE